MKALEGIEFIDFMHVQSRPMCLPVAGLIRCRRRHGLNRLAHPCAEYDGHDHGHMSFQRKTINSDEARDRFAGWKQLRLGHLQTNRIQLRQKLVRQSETKGWLS